MKYYFDALVSQSPSSFAFSTVIFFILLSSTDNHLLVLKRLNEAKGIRILKALNHF